MTALRKAELRNFDPELFDGLGRPRVPAEDKPYTFVSGPHHMDNLPAKFSRSIEQNQKLQTCCRNVENMRATLYRSPTAPDEPGADVVVVQCEQCLRRQTRLMVGAARF